MEFRTVVDIPEMGFRIGPCEKLLFVGSCFADHIGRRFQKEKFRATVNPYGVMYNPASILHTVQRIRNEELKIRNEELKIRNEKLGIRNYDYQTSVRAEIQQNYQQIDQQSNHNSSFLISNSSFPNFSFLTLGTNHVYRLKETGEIVDNCQKRPQALFQEEELTVDQCADYLQQTIDLLLEMNPAMHVVLTVSPIRYRKYGYHGSQLSKATLLLAADKVCHGRTRIDTDSLAALKSPSSPCHSDADNIVRVNPCQSVAYFPAYEIVNDELRDYRFYAEDMLHPSAQAVEYIWQRLSEACLSDEARAFIREWAPLKAALNHRPFNPDSDEYRAFMDKTMLKVAALQKKYPTFAL